MKKLLFLSLSALALLLPATASAYTVDELVNANGTNAGYSYAFETVKTPFLPVDTQWAYDPISYEYASSGECKITKTSQGYLSINGLMKGNLEIIFQLSGSTLTSVSASTAKMVANNRPISGAACAYAGMYYTIKPVTYNTRTHGYTASSGNLTASVSYYDGIYTIKIPRFQLAISSNSRMTSSTVTNYEGIEIDIPAYEFNGMASDQVGGINRTYPIEGGFNWDYNYLSLVNFACSGYALHHSTYYISSYYGIVGIESERFDVGANVTKTSTTKGTISFPSQEIQSELNGTQILMLNICPSTATRLGASVNGSYEIKGFSHVNESRWHKVCGGNLETALDFEIKVNDYKVRNDATGLQTSPWYNTVINLKDEYTHYVEQNINSLDVSSTSGQAIVTTTIKNPKNNDHVETYDLYIVPGAFTSINNTSFSTHKDKGHDMGVLLKSGIKADGAQQTVSVNDFYPEIKGLGEGNMNDKYTLYLKANYTKSSGLEPTFHALATQMVTTGLESIEAEEVDVPAIFFNMNGVQVDGENMAPGVYIKKEGNKTSKVVIR